MGKHLFYLYSFTASHKAGLACHMSLASVSCSRKQNTEFCPVPQTLVRAQCLWITTSVTGMDLVKFHSCWLEISLSCSEQSQVTSHGRHKGQSPLAGKGAGVGKRHLSCPLHPPYQCHMGDEFCFTGTGMNFRCCIPSMKQFHPLRCCVCSETLKKRKI